MTVLEANQKKLLPWTTIKLVTLLCKPSRGPGLALGPLGAPEYESRLNSRSRVPLSTFSCRFYQNLGGGRQPRSIGLSTWTVHVDKSRHFRSYVPKGRSEHRSFH